MKKIILMIFIITILLGCSKTVNTDDVVYSEEIRKVVLKNSGNKPFTGKVLYHNKEGVLQFELQYKDGINFTDNLKISINSLCNIKKQPFEYYWDIELDTLGIFLKDFYAPFSGILVYNSETDTLFKDNELNFGFESTYKSGFKNGLSKYYRNGVLESVINYKNNKLHGYAKNYYENGNIQSESNFKNGKLSGVATSFHQNGKIESKINYDKGIITDNKVSEFYDSGNLKSTIQYADGKINGFLQEFYENEKPKCKINYKDGEINGKWSYWKMDGELLDSGNLTDGTGVIKHYYDNYNLKYEANYKNDKFDGVVTKYNESGKLLIQENYIEGLKDGECVAFFENGKLKEKSNYKDGKLNGKQLVYFENGSLSEETNYKNGLKNGWDLTYNTDGSLKYDFYYVNDKYEYKEYKKINPKINRYIKFVKAKLERYEKNYDRNSKPYSAHVRAYFQFKNKSQKKIVAIKFDFTFKDVFGDILYDGSAKYDLNLSSGEKNSMNLYWYWEDSYSSPYKKLWSPVESGNVKTEVNVTKIVFSDGSIIE
ncbi:MAG: toxin-antitoxin system YwqK family antitoxin [Candidatus Tenebribacter mawsonii]|nr:toxin-antitoxin system YwqK family antitoxin [Candidatus Tenebribacter mawsonii]